MDDPTKEVLLDFGIDPLTTPPGTVRLLSAAEFKHLGQRAFIWSLNPNNSQALAYEIETEHERHVGIVLRNLHSDKERAAHLTLVNGPGPFWHNFTPSLDWVWETGVAVLVEGPKDARFLYSHQIPAMAYLGAAPSTNHLRVLGRYTHTVIWIPDNEPLTREVVARRKQVMANATKQGLNIRQFRIPVKDPAELIRRPDYVPTLKSQVEEAAILSGGGWR
jgi:hypothetical protein